MEKLIPTKTQKQPMSLQITEISSNTAAYKTCLEK